MTRPPEFEPPYESPVEEQFAWTFHKLLNPECDFRKQHEVVTTRGRFRLDFMLVTRGGRRLGIEIDGKDFHSYRRDAWRDAMILGERHADVILRFAARDIYYRLFDAIAVIRYLYPEVFNRHQVLAVDRLVSPEVEEQVREAPEFIWVRYDGEELSDGSPIEMLVSHEGHTDSSSALWKEHYAFARKHPEIALDRLHDACRDQAS
ncbi:MAG TPA: hypothetical protein VFI39_04225 [Gemmatimonadales bacterium]|nr:hypothetical protein [Gemmatimonadales bacterium]